MHDLLKNDDPEIGSGFGINDSGEIVGVIGGVPANCGEGTFVYQNGSMWALEKLIDRKSPFYGHVLFGDAFAVNNQGQIAVMGIDRRDDSKAYYHGYVLTPVPVKP